MTCCSHLVRKKMSAACVCLFVWAARSGGRRLVCSHFSIALRQFPQFAMRAWQRLVFKMTNSICINAYTIGIERHTAIYRFPLVTVTAVRPALFVRPFCARAPHSHWAMDGVALSCLQPGPFEQIMPNYCTRCMHIQRYMGYIVQKEAAAYQRHFVSDKLSIQLE